MANPTSRDTLITYCLRQLGEPVLEVNVDEDQIQDRVDEALQYWQEYHSDASKKIYYTHKITADDKAKKYIDLSNTQILWVERILPMDSSGSNFLFDVEYQMRLSDMNRLMSMGGISEYTMMQQSLSLYDMQIGTGSGDLIRFSRHEKLLFLDVDDKDLKVDDHIIIAAYTILDPNNVAAVYNDRLLKKYTTALIKRQWGANLIKFDGMVLPGGVTLNGRQIYDDAVVDIEKIEENIRLDYELPIDFAMG
jgi:hypothetical protein